MPSSLRVTATARMLLKWLSIIATRRISGWV
jgi:hypothetical protein